jgi:hypothetical protein
MVAAMAQAFRSPAGAAAAAPPPAAGVPHWVQKRAPAATGAPQEGHGRGPREAPQWRQKFPSASAPQEGHLVVLAAIGQDPGRRSGVVPPGQSSRAGGPAGAEFARGRQQIRGSWSPGSMSTMRVPPSPVRSTTMPGCASTAVPAMTASAPPAPLHSPRTSHRARAGRRPRPRDRARGALHRPPPREEVPRGETGWPHRLRCPPRMRSSRALTPRQKKILRHLHGRFTPPAPFLCRTIHQGAL